MVAIMVVLAAVFFCRGRRRRSASASTRSSSWRAGGKIRHVRSRNRRPPSNPRHKWYIVHAYSNFEKKVAESIREQAKTQGLEENFSDILVPTEDVVEIRRGRKVNAERKFFPGYVLVKMELTDEAYHLIKNTPKVTGFLGSRLQAACRSPRRKSPASSAPSKRASSVPSPPSSFEIGETGARHRRPVRQLQRLGGTGRRGTRPPARHRLDLRPRHPGRAGIRPGREERLSLRPSRASSAACRASSACVAVAARRLLH